LKAESGRKFLEKQAEIMQEALTLLAVMRARPVLPLHDAIATAEPDKAIEAMEEASRKALKLGENEALPLKIKTARQRALFTG
jgi:hypothetical protein